MPGRLCPVLKQHSESGHGRLFHLEAWLSCGVAKTRPHATAHSGMIVSMCSDELVRQVPLLTASWQVHLRSGAKPHEDTLAEVLPLVFRLEQAGYHGARPPWPAEATEGLALSRRIRSAVRSIERIGDSGATITLTSAQVGEE